MAKRKKKANAVLQPDRIVQASEPSSAASTRHTFAGSCHVLARHTSYQWGLALLRRGSVEGCHGLVRQSSFQLELALLLDLL